MKSFFILLLFLSTLVPGIVTGMSEDGSASVIFTRPKNSAQEIIHLFKTFPVKAESIKEIENFYVSCINEAASQTSAILDIPERYSEMAKKSCTEQDYLCDLHFRLVSGIASGTIGLIKSSPLLPPVIAKKKVTKKESSSVLTSLCKFKDRIARAAHNNLYPYEVLGLTNPEEKKRTLKCYTTIEALLTPREGKKKSVIDVMRYKKMFERLNRRVEKTVYFAFEICRAHRHNPTKAIELMNSLITINRPAFPKSLLDTVNGTFFKEYAQALKEYTLLATTHVSGGETAEKAPSGGKKDEENEEKYEEIP